MTEQWLTVESDTLLYYSNKCFFFTFWYVFVRLAVAANYSMCFCGTIYKETKIIVWVLQVLSYLLCHQYTHIGSHVVTFQIHGLNNESCNKFKIRNWHLKTQGLEKKII